MDNWRTNSSEIKGLSSSPEQKSFQRASPCLFSAPLPPSLQQPAGTLLLCYSWPACSCSYSPRLTQQQLLYVCQLASRSPKSSCPPRSPCFPASPPTDLLLLPHHVSHLQQSAPVSCLLRCPEPTPLLSWFTLLALQEASLTFPLIPLELKQELSEVDR